MKLDGHADRPVSDHAFTRRSTTARAARSPNTPGSLASSPTGCNVFPAGLPDWVGVRIVGRGFVVR